MEDNIGALVATVMTAMNNIADESNVWTTSLMYLSPL